MPRLQPGPGSDMWSGTFSAKSIHHSWRYSSGSFSCPLALSDGKTRAFSGKDPCQYFGIYQESTNLCSCNQHCRNGLTLRIDQLRLAIYIDESVEWYPCRQRNNLDDPQMIASISDAVREPPIRRLKSQPVPSVRGKLRLPQPCMPFRCENEKQLLQKHPLRELPSQWH